MASYNNNNPSSARSNRLAPPTTPRAAATPIRRALSAEPTSGRLTASGRRPTGTTPHARAAIRALDQRRAALFTPGRARRRSLREQRETSWDVLHQLSRVLAPTTQPVRSSSSSSPGSGADSTLPVLPEQDDEDEDDEFPIEKPRFSLPLGDDEDDSDSDLKVPRSSGLEDENFTVQSIELPRRARSEGPLGGLDRGSLGSVRFSDYAGPELRSDDEGIDSGFFPPPALGDESMGLELGDGDTLERFDAEETRRQTLGRGSDVFGVIDVPDLGNESSFAIAPVDSPERDPTVYEDIVEDAGPDITEEQEQEQEQEQELEGDTDSDEPTGRPVFEDDNDNIDETMLSRTADLTARNIRRKKGGKKISKYGIEYPALPIGVVKRLATTLAKTSGASKSKLGPDTMAAIMQATDWFFEQLGDDLQAYAKHAGRKTIDESDMITLMRRQRQVSSTTTPFALAQRHLPRELLQELRMPVNKK